MILKVIVGQRWRHVYKNSQVYVDSIIEVIELLDSGRPKLKVIQVFENTNNDSEVCRPVGANYESWTLPYGNASNVWELLQNQEAPLE